MAFTEQNMGVLSRRVTAFMQSLQNLREESAALVAIYTNEAGGGSEPAWGDTDTATAAEHVAAITLFNDLKDFCEGGPVGTANRQVNMTPFLQGG